MTTDFIKTAVIGHPIAHSKSPLLHNHWISHYGLHGEYKAIDIAPDNLKAGIQALIDDGYTGFNVTVPHKVAIMDLCDELSDIAQEIGAVNTVTIQNGKLYGTNTDAYGFIQNIKENIQKEWHFNNGRALVLGAGGAANAIIYALIEEGVPEIILTNRTREKADTLKSLSPEKITVVDWEERNAACKNTNLIVNSTALGMCGKPPLDIDLSLATRTTLVTDIVYAPLYTDLLQQAQNHEMHIITGIGMLLHQARPGFEMWNGVMPEVNKTIENLILN